MEYQTHIGNRTVWGASTPFGISPAARRRHLYCIGKTGTGKTTLLKNLICQDIEQGHGVGVIDPHGDLAEELLSCIPPWRTHHVTYFNPADSEFPVGFNLVHSSLGDRKYLDASAVVGACKHIWRESWGPRLEYILYASVAALMDCENTSLLGIPRLLTDSHYRDWVVRQVRDPMVRAFWEREFANYDRKFVAEAIAPIQNKIGQLLMASPLRNVFGQIRSRIDPRFIMDNRRIFIANLAKGRLGEDKSNLLGALLVSKFQTAAMERADMPETERKDFYLFIDEFQNFSTDSFAGILSEARKYRLCLTLSHQYRDQMPEAVKGAVFGNVGSIISFRVGVDDAAVLAREFGNGYAPEQFTDLANHEILVKLSDDGHYRQPFLAKTDPPYSGLYGNREKIIRLSRERYATRRAVVEDRFRRWLSK